MYCRICGCKMDDGAQVCGVCGTYVVQVHMEAAEQREPEPVRAAGVVARKKKPVLAILSAVLGCAVVAAMIVLALALYVFREPSLGITPQELRARVNRSEFVSSVQTFAQGAMDVSRAGEKKIFSGTALAGAMDIYGELTADGEISSFDMALNEDGINQIRYMSGELGEEGYKQIVQLYICAMGVYAASFSQSDVITMDDMFDQVENMTEKWTATANTVHTNGIQYSIRAEYGEADGRPILEMHIRAR